MPALAPRAAEPIALRPALDAAGGLHRRPERQALPHLRLTGAQAYERPLSRRVRPRAPHSGRARHTAARAWAAPIRRRGPRDIWARIGPHTGGRCAVGSGAAQAEAQCAHSSRERQSVAPSLSDPDPRNACVVCVWADVRRRVALAIAFINPCTVPYSVLVV
eukprot:5399549-Prymnesium_polylepis.1